MKHILLLLSILFSNYNYGQSFKKNWDKTFGGNNQDLAADIIYTNDGGYIAVGSSYSSISGDKSQNSLDFDIWIIKLNSNGDKIWDKTIGYNRSEVPKKIIANPDGSYLLYSHSNSFYNTDLLMKLDENGTMIWEKYINRSAYGFIGTMIASNDGGYVIIGQNIISNINSGDYWILKINYSGDIIWEKTIGGNGFDIVSSITNSPDGGFVILGHSNSGISPLKSEASKGEEDFWVIKLDNLGNIIWEKTIGGNSMDISFSIVGTLDEGYLLVGSSISNISGDKSENRIGPLYLPDYWIVKIDKNGIKLWDKTIGGNDTDMPKNILKTKEGNFIISGVSSSNVSANKTENCKGGLDYWFVKIDNNGNILYDKTFGGSRDDGRGFDHYSNINFATIAKNNTLTTIASSESNVSSEKSENSRGREDFWIININDSIYSLKSGYWNDLSTWSCNCVPSKTDEVIIQEGHEVIIPNGIFKIKNIINQGVLNFENDGTLEVNN